MIDIADLIKLKIKTKRDELNIHGSSALDLEDRIDDIKLRIDEIKLKLGYEVPTTPMVIPKTTQKTKAIGLADRLMALQK